MTVYADILLLVNISMDILSLYIVGKITHRKMKPRRIFFSAVIGGVTATLSTALLWHDDGDLSLINLVIGAAVSVLMIRVGFGKQRTVAGLLRDGVMLWGSGALIGGIMSVILSFGDPASVTGGNGYISFFAITASLSVGLVRLFGSRSAKRTAEISVNSGNERYSIIGLCDSGSFASEPISGLPVIIVKAAAMENTSRMLHSEECGLRLRMVPLKGIGGERVLFGFVPEEIRVGDSVVSAVVAIDESGGTFGGYMAIIPSCLSKGI